MREFCLAVLLLAVGGCASVAWTKPGVTEEEFAADSRQCQADAWQEANWMSLDRTSMYGGRWTYPDPLGRPLMGYPYAPFGDPLAERYVQEVRLAEFCMRSKGYELTKVDK
jgi:hypothetical protein